MIMMIYVYIHETGSDQVDINASGRQNSTLLFCQRGGFFPGQGNNNVPTRGNKCGSLPVKVETVRRV
jgi:hypothetical protein